MRGGEREMQFYLDSWNTIFHLLQTQRDHHLLSDQTDCAMRKINLSQGPHLTPQQLSCQETETGTQSTAGSCSQGSQRQSTDRFPTLQVPGKARIIMFDWGKSNPAETAAGTWTGHKTQLFVSSSVMRTSPGHGLYPHTDCTLPTSQHLWYSSLDCSLWMPERTAPHKSGS